MSKKHLALIVGTRPNLVKAGPLLRALREQKDAFDVTLIHTGQHYDASMSDIFLQELEIGDPDICLNASGSSHVQTIANIIRRLHQLFTERHFDAIVVFGDVNSTLAAAIAATKRGKYLIHVEAGLRSNDRRMPEEINRVITDHISDIHFTTEPAANEHLREEGIEDEKVFYVGNIMIDSLMKCLGTIDQTRAHDTFGVREGEYILGTFHRQENVDDPFVLRRMFTVLQKVARMHPFILPLHPRTKQKIEEHGFANLLEDIRIIEPQGYVVFTSLMKHAKAVMTDSGGIQEESTWLNVPCITLRDNTERPITVTHGTNRLIRILDDAFEDQVFDSLRVLKHRVEPIPLWDGQTAGRIVEVLKRVLV